LPSGFSTNQTLQVFRNLKGLPDQHGYQVIVHKTDGTTEVRDLALPEGMVVLDPDVRTYFPDSETVNRALRGLIDLIPEQHIPSKATS